MGQTAKSAERRMIGTDGGADYLAVAEIDGVALGFRPLVDVYYPYGTAFMVRTRSARAEYVIDGNVTSTTQSVNMENLIAAWSGITFDKTSSTRCSMIQWCVVPRWPWEKDLTEAYDKCGVLDKFVEWFESVVQEKARLVTPAQVRDFLDGFWAKAMKNTPPVPGNAHDFPPLNEPLTGDVPFGSFSDVQYMVTTPLSATQQKAKAAGLKSVEGGKAAEQKEAPATVTDLADVKAKKAAAEKAKAEKETKTSKGSKVVVTGGGKKVKVSGTAGPKKTGDPAKKKAPKKEGPPKVPGK